MDSKFLWVIIWTVVPVIGNLIIVDWKNWDKLHTIGDILFPRHSIFGPDERKSLLYPFLYWCPVISLAELTSNIIGLLGMWFVKTKIYKAIKYFFNIKIK